MADELYVLGADVGGTKTLVRLARLGESGLVTAKDGYYRTGEWRDMLRLLYDFLGDCPPVAAAVIAVAAPVDRPRLKLTNQDFWIDADVVRASCGMGEVRLVNDFVAVAEGIAALAGEDLLVLQGGMEIPTAPRAVLGAGTGLGEAILVWRDSGYEVLASEGGHVDFAPQDEVQIGLWRFLAARHGHVSYERVLSGPGLAAIHEYLTGEVLAPEAITAASDAACRASVDLFMRIYGQQAGNLALTAWARGGVYVAGGLAAALGARLRAGPFMEAFHAKGRYREFLATVPVRVVLDREVGLKGALAAAARLVNRRSST